MQIELLTEHYQKTYEQTYDHWRQRNRIFLFLLVAISFGGMITFGAPKTDPLLVYMIAKWMGINDATGRGQIQSGFSFALLQCVYLTLVFYLMVNLHHRAKYVLRNYQYLSKLEEEIRQTLKLGPDSIAFSREGGFYWQNRNWASAAVKWMYIGMLGTMLATFLGLRTFEDFQHHHVLLGFTELAIAISTLVFYFDYAISSVKLDTR